MFQQIISIFRPTTLKVMASMSFVLVYFTAAFVRIASARFFLGPLDAPPSRGVLLIIVNWIVIAALLYVAASFIFSKNNVSEYSLKRKEVLVFVTILGLLASPLFFEMPRFLSSFFPSLASSGGTGSIMLIVAAELLLSYALVSLLMSFMGKLKKR